MTITTLRPDLVLGDTLPENGGTIIAWGWVNAVSDDDHTIEQDRWCVLTLLPAEHRIPNVANYEVVMLYPWDGDVSPARVEASTRHANIGPAVEQYADWGMDW